MAKATVYLLVEMTIHDGQSAAFETVARKMIAGTQTEPGSLAYEFYLSSDGKRGRLLETYAGPDALLAHFSGPVVVQLVAELRQHVTVDRFEVYGDPGPQMAPLLAKVGAQVFSHWGGLDR